jgi:hypothetical protein
MSLSGFSKSVIYERLCNDGFGDPDYENITNIIKIIEIIGSTGLSENVLSLVKKEILVSENQFSSEQKYLEDFENYDSNEIVKFVLSRVSSSCIVKSPNTLVNLRLCDDNFDCKNNLKLFRLEKVLLKNCQVQNFFNENHTNYLSLREIVITDSITLENILVILNHFSNYKTFVRNYLQYDYKSNLPTGFIIIFGVSKLVLSELFEYNDSLLAEVKMYEKSDVESISYKSVSEVKIKGKKSLDHKTNLVVKL